MTMHTTHLVRTALFLSLAALFACTDRQPDSARATNSNNAQPPAPTNAPAALTMAHDAYLAGDYVEMGERLKEVIVDPRTGELARDNAFALLESAYEATHGRLPARAAPLPKAVSVISLGVINGSHPFGPHRLVYFDMHVSEGRAAHVKDIRVTKLPSEPILALVDKRAERGEFRVAREAGYDDVKLELRQLEVLPDRGAFTIQVVFDDGAPGVDAFILANKLVVSAQAEVTSPAVSQVLKDPRPEIAWRPYRSPEFASWETRALSVSISRDSGKQLAWTFYKWQPEDLGSAVPDVLLEPDSYWVSVMSMEHRMFGGILISRATDTSLPFSVVR